MRLESLWGVFIIYIKDEVNDEKKEKKENTYRAERINGSELCRFKILVFSDTHGYTDKCIEAINSNTDADMILHAGDCVEDAENLSYIFPKIKFEYVRGNNDLFSNAADEKIINAAGKKIFLTHGHEYGVKYSMKALYSRAVNLNADIAVFGHTHEPFLNDTNKAVIFNPGACGMVRSSYGIVTIESGEISTKICRI